MSSSVLVTSVYPPPKRPLSPSSFLPPSGPLIQKVADAAAIVNKQRPDIFCEGPLQYDAAVNPETARTKLKGRTSEVAGKVRLDCAIVTLIVATAKLHIAIIVWKHMDPVGPSHHMVGTSYW